MADVTKITLPDGTTKDIKDATARTATTETYDRVCSKNLLLCGNNNLVAYGLTISCNNGEITLSGTANETFSLYISGTISTDLTEGNKFTSKLPNVIAFSGAPTTNSKDRIIFALYNDSTWVYSGSTNDIIHDLTGKTYNNWFVYIPIVSGNSYNGTWKPMLCAKSDWDISHDYVPYNTLDGTTLPIAVKELSDADGQKNLLQLSLDEMKAQNTSGASWNGNACTINGITFTVNSDYTITVAGTLTSGAERALFKVYYHHPNTYGGMFLTGCPEGGGTSTWQMVVEQTAPPWSSIALDNGRGATILNYVNNYIYVYIQIRTTSAVNLTFKPMICTKAQWDISTNYQPYALSNAELTPNVLWNTNNGVKNLLKNNAVSGNSKGVTYTVNADGSISTSGTSNANYFSVTLNTFTFEQGKTYYITGCPSGGSTSGYSITNIGATYFYDTGNGATVTGDGQTRTIMVYANNSGTNMNGLTFKPMIREVGDSTYEPYSLPNTKITPELIELVDSGAKNLAKFTSPQSLISVNGCTITVSGTVSTTGTRWLWEGQVDNGTYAFAVNYKSGDITTFLYNATDDANIKSFTGTSGVEFVSLVSGKTYKIGMYMSTGSTITGQEDIMLCTKAAWDVSQKFVPYRPTYEETVEQVVENENNILLRPEVLVQSVTNITSTTTLDDTGVSYTIPSGAYVRITATARYGQSNPEEIMIWTGSSVFAHTVAITGDNTFALTATTLIGGISGDTTAKIYARFRGANTNAIILEVESVPNPT